MILPLAIDQLTRVGMSFRVLIAGGRRFTNYPVLRAALDALLVKRLSDVILVPATGAASRRSPPVTPPRTDWRS
jgi:hypothetical protein